MARGLLSALLRLGPDYDLGIAVDAAGANTLLGVLATTLVVARDPLVL